MFYPLSLSGPNCQGLSRCIPGASPSVVPACSPEQLPVWSSWWEGAGVWEEGTRCLAIVMGQSCRNGCLPKWVSKHFGKRGSACVPATLRPRSTTGASVQGGCSAGPAGIPTPRDTLAGGRRWGKERVLHAGLPLPGCLGVAALELVLPSAPAWDWRGCISAEPRCLL